MYLHDVSEVNPTGPANRFNHAILRARTNLYPVSTEQQKFSKRQQQGACSKSGDGGQKQTRIEQDGGEGIRTPIKRSHESVNPFRRKQQKCPIAGNLNALTPPKPRAPSLDGSDSESDIVIPRVSPAPFSVASTAQKAPGGNGDDEFPDPTLNLAQYEVLNQATTWVCNGVDLIPRFRDFRAGNLGPFSLVRDGIADMTHGSSFAMTLPSNALSEARKVASTPDVDAKWPTLQGIADRVFRNNTYDEIAQAVRKENMEDPVAAYLFSIVMAYFHYFRFHAEIPGDLNEREGFTDLTWSFIRGALTMTNIESRHLEVLITGAQERKNHSRNPFFDIMETGHYCDGLAFSGKDQIFLAEASQIQNAKADKMCQDQYKLARALRDSWLSQLKSICREAVPPRDFAVFGSCTYKDETRLLQLDFQGTFRLCQFDSFLIPLKRNEFGRRMSLAVQSCLKLALRIEQEISKRNLAAPASFDTQQQLSDALSRTIVTTATPTKPRKKKSI
ncbi:hypothetical protein BGW41_007771 [Actinomortierella wolfii]|nr:hypothetical protein BGW41_007771 [Actinomortierella wolfii]